MPAELSGVDRHTVAGATMHRKSARAFLDTPVDNDLIAQLLETASNETTRRGGCRAGHLRQEHWTVRSKTVSEFLGTPLELMLFCGMAIGHEDTNAPINSCRSDRLPLRDWATFVE